MQQSLQGIQGVRNIADDIIVHGKSREEHDTALRNCLKRLQEKGLTLNAKKCSFLQPTLEFFGQIFSAEGKCPDPKRRVTDLQNMPTPTNAQEVRSLLGMANYSSKYIRNYATITSPLRELTKKNVRFSWTEIHQNAFTKLKDALIAAPVMGYFDISKSTTITVDASPVGISAILAQGTDSDYKVIAYASRALTDVKKQYSQTEKEALSIVWGIEHFHLYLYGKEFTHITDHKPLEIIYGTPTSKPSARLTLGVPQGSVLGPLLFNIYINDLLLSLNNTDVCNYADDTTLFACDIDTDNVVTRLEIDSAHAIKWFSDNYMKLNEDKCHLLTFGNMSSDSVSVKIGSSTIANSTEEKLLGVTLDSKLTFEQHVSNLCQKVSNKLYALSRIAHYMDQAKLRMLMTSFINSQFQYCPLAWMFHSRKLNTKINKLHERALRITYRDQESSFEDLLGHDNSVSVHQKSLQVLMIEMFKTKHGLNPPFMKEIFCPQTNQYSLRNDRDFNLPRVRSVMYGSETVRYRGPQLWCTLPVSIRHSTNLIEFKTKIKAWKGNECQCQCRLCRNFIPLLGFI